MKVIYEKQINILKLIEMKNIFENLYLNEIDFTVDGVTIFIPKNLKRITG